MVCWVWCAEDLDVIKESDAGGNSGGAPEASVVESAMRFCPQFRCQEKWRNTKPACTKSPNFAQPGYSMEILIQFTPRGWRKMDLKLASYFRWRNGQSRKKKMAGKDNAFESVDESATRKSHANEQMDITGVHDLNLYYRVVWWFLNTRKRTAISPALHRHNI